VSLAPAALAQPDLCALQAALEFLQARARGRAPPVEPGAQQRDAIPVVAGLRLQLLDLVAGAHELETAVARVPAQGYRERGRLGSRLEVGNPLGLPRRLTVHRVLKSLQ
jgi:hypothetical protein